MWNSQSRRLRGNRQEVHRPPFTLANTMYIIPACLCATKLSKKPFILSGTETTRDDTSAAATITEPWKRLSSSLSRTNKSR